MHMIPFTNDSWVCDYGWLTGGLFYQNRPLKIIYSNLSGDFSAASNNVTVVQRICGSITNWSGPYIWSLRILWEKTCILKNTKDP